MDTKERKNATWTFAGTILTVTFPNAEKLTFNLDKLTEGMKTQQVLMFQYGVKQWLASNSAPCKTIPEKIESMEADFAGLVEHGIEMLGEGKIGIIGKERANAKPKTNDKLIEAQFENYTVKDIDELLRFGRMGVMKLSAEMVEKLEMKKLELEEKN